MINFVDIGDDWGHKVKALNIADLILQLSFMRECDSIVSLAFVHPMDAPPPHH